jgi:hypothetical protein
MTDVDLVDALPDESLPVSTMKELLSLAYAKMLAAAAGCTVASYNADHDAVDISIRSSAEFSYRAIPQVDIQLKCTGQQDVVHENHVAWRIDERTHGKLTNAKRQSPVILAVLVVPHDHNSWLDLDEERLLTKSIMYWVSGRDIDPDYPAGQEKMTVQLPKANQLTRASLLGILQAIGEGSPGWRT